MGPEGTLTEQGPLWGGREVGSPWGGQQAGGGGRQAAPGPVGYSRCRHLPAAR